MHLDAKVKLPQNIDKEVNWKTLSLSGGRSTEGQLKKKNVASLSVCIRSKSEAECGQQASQLNPRRSLQSSSSCVLEKYSGPTKVLHFIGYTNEVYTLPVMFEVLDVDGSECSVQLDTNYPNLITITVIDSQTAMLGFNEASGTSHQVTPFNLIIFDSLGAYV